MVHMLFLRTKRVQPGAHDDFARGYYIYDSRPASPDGYDGAARRRSLSPGSTVHLPAHGSLRRHRQSRRAFALARDPCAIRARDRGGSSTYERLLVAARGLRARRARVLRRRRARRQRDAALQDRCLRVRRRSARRAPSRRVRSIRWRCAEAAIVGDNTDGAGLVRDLTANLGLALAGRAHPASGRRRCRARRGWRHCSRSHPRCSSSPTGRGERALELAHAASAARVACDGIGLDETGRELRPRGERHLLFHARRDARACPGASSRRGRPPTTWPTGPRRGPFSTSRARPEHGRATAWACWSSRRRSPSACGAGKRPDTAGVIAGLRAA